MPQTDAFVLPRLISTGKNPLSVAALPISKLRFQSFYACIAAAEGISY